MSGAWSQNPQTGFLEAHYENGFSSKKKEKFIEYLEKNPFKVARACDFIGLDENTFYAHERKDAVFAQKIQALRRRRIEEIEQALADCALKPEKTIDRIFFLKCWKPERYNPAQHVEYKNETKLIVHDALGYLDRQRSLEAEILKKRNERISDDRHTTTHSVDGNSNRELNPSTEKSLGV